MELFVYISLKYLLEIVLQKQDSSFPFPCTVSEICPHWKTEFNHISMQLVLQMYAEKPLKNLQGIDYWRKLLAERESYNVRHFGKEKLKRIYLQKFISSWLHVGSTWNIWRCGLKFRVYICQERLWFSTPILKGLKRILP